jgi:hypothetical protein
VTRKELTAYVAYLRHLAPCYRATAFDRSFGESTDETAVAIGARIENGEEELAAAEAVLASMGAPQ